MFVTYSFQGRFRRPFDDWDRRPLDFDRDRQRRLLVRQTRPARHLPPRVAHLRLDLPLGPHVNNNDDNYNDNYNDDNSSKTST